MRSSSSGGSRGAPWLCPPPQQQPVREALKGKAKPQHAQLREEQVLHVGGHVLQGVLHLWLPWCGPAAGPSAAAAAGHAAGCVAAEGLPHVLLVMLLGAAAEGLPHVLQDAELQGHPPGRCSASQRLRWGCAGAGRRASHRLLLQLFQLVLEQQQVRPGQQALVLQVPGLSVGEAVRACVCVCVCVRVFVCVPMSAGPCAPGSWPVQVPGKEGCAGEDRALGAWYRRAPGL